ncbi:hypothetical protein ACTXPH_08295 [Arthrobacter rhombi]
MDSQAAHPEAPGQDRPSRAAGQPWWKIICPVIRDACGIMPQPYFRWTESSAVRHWRSFLLLGQGEIAPLTREVLRGAEPNPRLRPRVHIGRIPLP